MAKRIIAAARKGERSVTRLRDIALAALRDAKNCDRIPGPTDADVADIVAGQQAGE